MNEKDKKYWIWFSRIQGLNCIQKQTLLNKFDSPEKIWYLDKSVLKGTEGINDNCANEILNENYRKNLEKYEEYMNKNNINIITILDKQYPEKLRNIYDKPITLFTKGNIELLKKDGVAIVGCRDCSTYGRNTAKKLAYDLAKHNKCIISGLAKGIDKYSHIGALEASGSTIAVIGNGLDNIYPYENKELSERIIKNNGLIITEYIIGTRPDRINFPARNRIISGLADGIIVVEAKEKSGSLITADFGLEHGKEIFAVPGNVDSVNSFGTNELIKQGANLVTDFRDIVNVCYS